MHKIIVPVLLLVAASGTSMAQQDSWGVWTDNKEVHTYAFLNSNDFKFWGQKAIWVPPRINVFPRESGRYEYAPAKTDGAWQQGTEVCWLGEKKQQSGNMLIYADTLQCCMTAQFLGNKLVLSEVWLKGTDELGICTNRVLLKTEKIPTE